MRALTGRRLALLLAIQIPKESLPTLHPHSRVREAPERAGGRSGPDTRGGPLRFACVWRVERVCRSRLACRSALGALAFCGPHSCGFGPPRVFRAVAICSTQGLHKCADLRREKAPVRVNGVQPNVGKDLPIEQHGFDPACIDIGTDQETRSGTQAHTLDHHGAECAAVICQNSAVELDPSLVAVALKNPCSPRAWLNEHDPAVPLQILRLARIAISAQV